MAKMDFKPFVAADAAVRKFRVVLTKGKVWEGVASSIDDAMKKAEAANPGSSAKQADELPR